MDPGEILPFIFSAVTALAGWLAGAHKRRNDFLADMQSSISLLSRENAQLLAENLSLKRELIMLKITMSKHGIIVDDDGGQNGCGVLLVDHVLCCCLRLHWACARPSRKSGDARHEEAHRRDVGEYA